MRAVRSIIAGPSLIKGPRLATKEGPALVRLTRGLVLANWSSGHPFRFDDGTELPAVSFYRSSHLRLTPNHHRQPNDGGWEDVLVRWSLDGAAEADLLECAGPRAPLDILVVPRDALRALTAAGHLPGKARSIMRTERNSDVFRSDQFCLPDPFSL